jgi:hypothetical protein
MSDKVKSNNSLCYFKNPLNKKDIIEIFKFDKTKKIMIIKK